MEKLHFLPFFLKWHFFEKKTFFFSVIPNLRFMKYERSLCFSASDQTFILESHSIWCNIVFKSGYLIHLSFFQKENQNRTCLGTKTGCCASIAWRPPWLSWILWSESSGGYCRCDVDDDVRKCIKLKKKSSSFKIPLAVVDDSQSQPNCLNQRNKISDGKLPLSSY